MINDDELFDQADTTTPEDVIVQRERIDVALDCVDRLPGKRMRIIMLMRIAGYKHEEIGRALRLSSVVVRNYLKRARAKIDTMMQDYNRRGNYEKRRHDSDDSFDGRMQRVTESIEQVLKNGESDPGEEA